MFLVFFYGAFLQISTAQVKGDHYTPKTGKAAEALQSTIGISDATLFDQLLFYIPGVGSNSKMMLAEQNLKPYMMPPRLATNEALVQSYAIAASLEYYINYKNNYKTNLSPDYIALSLQSQEKLGGIEETLKFLVSDGTVSAAIMPFGSTAISSAVFATQKHQIKNYLHLFRPETKGKQKIYETKKSLMRGHPVVMELEVDDKFKSIKNKVFWTPNQAAAASIQTVVIVGYDEDMKAFEIMGARGSDWGINGYLLVDYDDFEKFSKNAFVLVP